MTESLHHFAVPKVQEILKEERLDGWLIFDFYGNNDIFKELFTLPEGAFLSRRFFYWIPRRGEAVKIVHKIESHFVECLPGKTITYATWQELDATLDETIKHGKKIAMEFSPKGAIPKCSKLDAGTYDYLVKRGHTIISSWVIAEEFVSRLTNEQIGLQKQAARILDQTIKKAFTAVLKGELTHEYAVQQFILKEFHSHGCITNHAPNVSFGPNSAIPHYSPTKESYHHIGREQILLIDAWCKKDLPQAPYADFTQVAYIGSNPTDEMLAAYRALHEAQNAAITLLQKKRGLTGAEVDLTVRKVIQKAGFDEFFIHRTGHNISTLLHGNGPNIDNYETFDTRVLLPRTSFSIEPGIYMPGKWGIRLECNVTIHSDGSIDVHSPAPKELQLL